MSQSSRELPDWLTEFVENTKWGEAPIYFYFWTGVATIAAALRRKVWLDMGTFVWRPNLYTLLVAPPGIIAKSSTSDLGMRLLRKLPGINWGPSTLTWQALYDAFSEVGEEFNLPNGELATQFALTINSSEFGITLNPKDNEMIDQLVHIWDGVEMKKRTRKDGELVIPTPCLNLIACTTPAWIAENVPQYLIGGGLTSRMLFVYGDTKARYIAYPHMHMPSDYKERQERLTRDLERISSLCGPFRLTPDAIQWGTEWYEDFHKNKAPHMDKSLLGGYIARKQTLAHKVAMCLAVSQGNELVISRQTLERATQLLDQLEKSMPMVYSQIGMSPEAKAANDALAFIDRYDGEVPYVLLYRYMHKIFPDPQKFDSILEGLIDAGLIRIDKASGKVIRVRAKEAA